MNTALLLIDIQNDYFPGGAWELSHADEAAAQARLALGRFREQHRPVFHVRHINTRPGAAFFLPDTPGSEIHGAVKPLDGEPAIIKHAPDAFFQTDLHDALRRCGAGSGRCGGHTETRRLRNDEPHVHRHERTGRPKPRLRHHAPA
jgi:nicotinamidase-related amidase